MTRSSGACSPSPSLTARTLENRATGGIAEMFVVTDGLRAPGAAIEFLRYLVDSEAGGAALVANDFIPSWDYPVPADKSDLYNNMVTAQATANSRVIYTTQVYAELLNAMQGIMDGESGSTVIDAMVAAARPVALVPPHRGSGRAASSRGRPTPCCVRPPR